MKKLLITTVLLTLSGCTLFDAYFMANFDSTEYALVNKIQTDSELAISDCSNQVKSKENTIKIYNTAVELKNYTQYIPNNNDANKLAGNLVELTTQGKDLYAKNTPVSETFCKLKLQQINRTSKTIQEVIGNKPR